MHWHTVLKFQLNFDHTAVLRTVGPIAVLVVLQLTQK